jgi:small-conductance mechanosensitive channel
MMLSLRRVLQGGVGLLLVLTLLVGTAFAQSEQTRRALYEDWLRLAQRAEAVVDADRASSASMEKLRAEIVEFREKFADVRTENAARIRTLRAQIAALPAKPEDGVEELQDIADLRAHLDARLEALTVPRIVAEEAFSRANGLVAEIDRLIRERYRGRLLRRGPTPLRPANWGSFLQETGDSLRAISNETKRNIALASTRENILDNLGGIFLLSVIGLALLVRGGTWSNGLGELLRRIGGRGSGVWSFVVSLLRIILPLLGTIALAKAVSLAGFPGVRGQLLLESVPRWASVFLIYHWIGGQILRNPENPRLQELSVARLTELRLQFDLLAVMLILWDMVSLFERIENISEAVRSVVVFPIIVMTALILFRLQRSQPLNDQTVVNEDGETVKRVGFSAVVAGIRRVLFLMCVLAPILAAAGYTFAAESLIFPAVNTLALIALIIILQRFLGDVAAWITGNKDIARDSLVTVVAGFVLSLAAIPALILLWGGRVADLTELWARFQAGFQIGGTTISPSNFISFAVIFALGYFLTRLLQSGLRNSLLPKTRIDPGGQNAIVSGTGYVGIALAAILAVTGAGLDLSSLAIVAGALSVGIGFGLQTIVSNFVSGIILLIERPISKGDWIEVNGMMGYVREISVRATRIETFDRTDVIVPNADFVSGQVTNYTRGNTIGRVIVPVGVAYGTDTRKVEKILSEVANSHPMVLANPAPSIVFQGFGADSLDFEIRAILRDVNWVLSVKSDLNHEVNRRFVEEGIEIPFAQRDIWLRNPEVLSGEQPLTAVPQAEGPKQDPIMSRVPSEQLDISDLDGSDADADGDGDGDR